MAWVHTFWQLSTDEHIFETYLCKLGGVRVFNSTPPGLEKPSDLKTYPVCEGFDHLEARNVYLCPEWACGNIDFMACTQNGQSLLYVSDMKSNVMGYLRSQLDDNNVLRRSNLYCYTSYPNEDLTEMIKKPDSFLRWEDRISRWLRKQTPEKCMLRNFFYPATKAAKDAVDRGVVILDY